MRDNLEKFKQYFTDKPTYWQLAPQIVTVKYHPGYYPLSFRDRLYQKHYQYFDKDGLPIFHSKAGKLVHFCTGMCSFAFAHWEEFLINEDPIHAEQVVKVARYLLHMAEPRENGALMVLDYDSDERDNGVSCAMNQGESISVLCRAYAYTKDHSFLEAAMKMAVPFQHPYGYQGVTSRLSQNQATWYLEGGKTILNGHIYALFGLFELANLSSETWIKELYQKGLESVVQSIGLYDTGNWSWYWLEEPRYIASAMYHNLHICQLKALGMQSESEELVQYADKFEKYARSPYNRLHSGFALLTAKIKKRLYPAHA